MAAVGEADSTLVSKCMAFCQALAIQGQAFNFSLAIGPTFNFSLDTRGKVLKGPVAKKRTSPSTLRRNAKSLSTRSSKVLQLGSQLKIVQLP